MKCTEPGRWVVAPASDAPSEVVEQYLAHVDKCPFHAALEQDEMEGVQRTIEAARSLSESGRLPLSAGEEATAADHLERYINFKRGEKRIKTVLLRGAGMEDKLLDVSRRREQISFNVPAPCSIQVLTPDDESGREILVATHVICVIPRRGAAPARSQVSLYGDQSLNFETRPLGGAWCQVAVTAGSLHKVAFADRLRLGTLTSWLRKQVPRVAVITVAVAFVAFIVSVLLWLGRRNESQIVNRAPAQPSGSAHEEQSHNTPPPSTSSQDTSSGTAPYEVTLSDGGGVIGLDENGKLRGAPTGLSHQEEKMLEAALRTRKAAVAPLPQELKRETEGRMGVKDAPAPLPSTFTLIDPVQKIVLTTTPRFTWNPMAGADSYNVRLFDSADQFVTESGPLKTTSWVVPQSKALTPGQIYVWKVVAVKDGEEVSSRVPAAAGARGALTRAKFKVLESAKAREVKRVKKAYGESHLLLGIVYAKASLLDEAEQEFNSLLRANPRSKVAQELLNSIRSVAR